MIQLTFIPETTEEKLDREMHELKKQQDKFRKSQFAKISAISKQVSEMRNELENLKMAICRTNDKAYFV